MRLSVGKKVGLSLGILAFLILITGLTGLHGVDRLSKTLDFLTGPAWDSADGAMEGTIELQAELLGLKDTLLGTHDTAIGQQKMQSAAASADEALQRMQGSGLLEAGQIDLLNQRLSTFRQMTKEVLMLHQQMINAEKAVGILLDKIDQSLGEVEERIESRMDGNAMIDMSAFETMHYWNIADAIMESRIGMLLAAHAMSQLTIGFDYQSQMQVVNAGLKQADDQFSAMLGMKNIIIDKIGDSTAIEVAADMFSKYQDDLRSSISLHERYKLRKEELDQQVQQMLALIATIEEAGDSQVEGQVEAISGTVLFASLLVGLTMLAGLMIAAVGYFLSHRFLVKPIKDVADALIDIAQHGGDLTKTLVVRGHDEIADLATGFNAFINKTREIIADVKQASEKVTQESQQLAEIIVETSRGANDQKAETEQVASAVTEMVATVSTVAGHAGEAAEISSKAGESASTGRSLVNQTSIQIKSLAEEMQKASATITQLHEHSETIGGVLDVIKTIAEQTNLLALNAAIEAARAGEQGRGFAVVADEVRTLASRTQDSTSEIESMIESLQRGAKQAVEVITASQEQSNKTTHHADQADQAIQQVVQAVNDIVRINQQIDVATTEQESAVNLIGQNAQVIHGISEETAAKAAQAESSTMELQNQSRQMQDKVAQFRV